MLMYDIYNLALPVLSMMSFQTLSLALCWVRGMANELLGRLSTARVFHAIWVNSGLEFNVLCILQRGNGLITRTPCLRASNNCLGQSVIGFCFDTFL
ncbi:hypothetical protein B0T26DRAFT_734108, partial [Lasiosphaeria miniovina]